MSRRAAALCVALAALGGCGTVGPPLPPEDVGVEPLVRQQKAAEKAKAAKPGSPLDSREERTPELVEPPGQDEALPPLRPRGPN